MRFRIGINVGDIMVKEGDIFGDGVNVAARLEGLVKGGEICVSRGVHDHLRHRPGMIFEDLGEQLVKNIAHPIRAFRLRIADVAAGQDPPSAETASEPPEIPTAPAEISELSADTGAALELAFWESIKDGSPAELESYLDRFPEGTFAALAKTRLDAALSSENPPDPATATAELSADSETALELAFWESVKDGIPAELETYLEKYPEGTFAALARARLESAALSSKESPDPETGSTGPDALDLAFWDSVKDSNRREELEAYLQQHPSGHFAALARARLSSSDVT